MPGDTKWITVNGSHIPVEGGETKRQAVNKLRDKNKYKTAGLHFNNTTPADRKVVKAIQKEFGNAKFVIRKDRHGDEILVPKKNVNRWKNLIRSFSDKTQYKLVEDERITSKNLGGNSLFWYPDSKGRLPNVNSIKRWATNYPDINVRKAAKEFQTKFGNVPLKKTMLQGQETALPEKNKWGYINAHNKVNTAYYTSPMFISKVKGGVKGFNKPVEEVPNRPRTMNITVNANGNEKIQQANKKLERYFLGSFAVGMLNGEKTILPKNKLRRKGFIKAFRKLNKEIDKTPGASMKVTVHDSMDAFYAGVRSVLIHIGNSYKKRHK